MRVGYARVSTKEQDLDGALAQQIDRLKGAGCEFIYQDVESGRKSGRVNYQKLMAECEVRKSGLTIVVTRLDRLTRSLIELRRFIDTVERTGVNIIALNSPVDYSTAAGRFQLNMVGAFAEMESDMMSERIRHGQAYRRKLNKPAPGYAPFGYRKFEDSFECDRAPVICFEGKEWSRADLARLRIDLIMSEGSLYRASKVYNSRIGLEILENGHPFGKLRTSGQGLSSWVVNPVLRGFICYGRRRAQGLNDQHKWDLREGNFEPILTQSEFKIIEQIILGNRKKERATSSGSFLFSGLLRCQKCQGVLSGRRWETKEGFNAHYFCKKRVSYAGCDSLGAIAENDLKAFVAEKLTDYAQEILNLEYLAVDETVDPEIASLESQLSELVKIPNPSQPIVGAINEIKNQIQQKSLREQIESSVGMKQKEELVEVFRDRDFWKVAEAQLTTAEIRNYYRKWIKTIWTLNGKIVSIDFVF